jgi:hypothetical protein
MKNFGLGEGEEKEKEKGKEKDNAETLRARRCAETRKRSPEGGRYSGWDALKRAPTTAGTGLERAPQRTGRA